MSEPATLKLPRDTSNVSTLADRVAQIGASAATFPLRPLRPLLGPYSVDDWGRDAHLVKLLDPLFGARWRTTIEGLDHLPARAGALLVCNDPGGSFAPLLAALALSRATARPVRFTGRTDFAPVGAVLRRLGGLIARSDEVEGALAHGELVIVGTEPRRAIAEIGPLDHRLVQPAVIGHHRIVPLAVDASPWSRAARLRLGSPLRTSSRRGPLAEVELADQAVQRIRTMLEAMGAI